VLIVDDEALIRWSLSEELSESGYRVRQAQSGAEARAVLATCGKEPLVVVLDLRLPDVSDLSLLREIRRARPDAPVVMMTAWGAADEAAEASRLGARFVGKPFDMAEMVRFVGEAWRGRFSPSPAAGPN
jgi:DNA-binding NtrC family response regulator